MNLSEIRTLSDNEIRTRIIDAREELMNLRFQQATGELTDYTRLSATRKRIARLLTILSEREKMAEMEGES
jgi:large subunit ribosomal protein L29